MSTIIGLDLSLSGTGVAKWRDGQVTWDVKGTAPHAKNQLEAPDHLWQCERNGVLLNFVKEWVLAGERPDLVVIEDVFMGANGSSALPLSQLAGLVKYWLHCVSRIPFTLVVGASVKKFAGVPKAEKGQQRPKGLICKSVLQNFNCDTNNDNCADAIAMTHMAAALTGFWEPRHQYQREVLDALLKKSPWLQGVRDRVMKPEEVF